MLPQNYLGFLKSSVDSARVVAMKGWTTVSLKDGLMEQIDLFIEDNKWGYTNRAEVVTAAVRDFILRHKERLEAEADKSRLKP